MTREVLHRSNFALFGPSDMVRPVRETFVSRKPALYYRLTVVGVLAAALALSACGRKGALDAPPGGLADAPGGSLNSETDEGGEVLRKGSARGLPIIKGPNKRIPLDALLD